MDIYFSDVFGVSPETLDEYGALDISLVNDLPLFIDPFLIFHSENGVYQELHEQIIEYLRFLRKQSSSELDPGLLAAWYQFPEVKENWLGFSRTGNQGRGLGKDFAVALNGSLELVFTDFGKERVTKGSHLEKLCLVKNGVGRDRISDFTANLILDFLASYTQMFAEQHLSGAQKRQHWIAKARFDYNTESWQQARYVLPTYRGDYVLLTPLDMLTREETWISRQDLERRLPDVAAAMPNAQLRAQLDNYLQKILPEDPSKKEWAQGVTEALEKFPELIDYYIRDREVHGDQALEQGAHHVAQVRNVFIDSLRDFVEELLVPAGFYEVPAKTLEETRARVGFLKDVIENKGGQRLFYDKEGKSIRREEDLQLLFRLCWYGTPSDVSREVNDGRGPVDYKVSRGARDKTLAEFKLAKNKSLERNLRNQVPIYAKAGDTQHALKVIIFFTRQELERVQRILRKLDMECDPSIVLIDARADNKPSGSKA